MYHWQTAPFGTKAFNSNRGVSSLQCCTMNSPCNQQHTHKYDYLQKSFRVWQINKIQRLVLILEIWYVLLEMFTLNNFDKNINNGIILKKFICLILSIKAIICKKLHQQLTRSCVACTNENKRLALDTIHLEDTTTMI